MSDLNAPHRTLYRRLHCFSLDFNIQYKAYHSINEIISEQKAAII